MSANIVTIEDLEGFQKNLLNLISKQFEESTTKKEYLTKAECFDLFAIKERTLTEMRAKREITFVKIGNSFRYKYSSIINYLESRKIEAIS